MIWLFGNSKICGKIWKNHHYCVNQFCNLSRGLEIYNICHKGSHEPIPSKITVLLKIVVMAFWQHKIDIKVFLRVEIYQIVGKTY